MSKYTFKTVSKATSRASRGNSISLEDVIKAVKSSVTVPEGGWTHENFVGSARKKLRNAMLQTQRLSVANASKTLTPVVREWLEGSVDKVIDRVAKIYRAMYGVNISKSVRGKDSVTVDLDIPVHEEIFANVIEQELDRANLNAAITLEPAIRNTVENIHDNVSVLLGSAPTQRQISALGIRTREIANKVTRINETTKQRLVNEVKYSVENNLTVFESIERIKDRMPQIATNRVPTIVRTELGRAADEAVKHSMVWAGNVTHFDVVGCESIEPNIPTLLGVPTCNIQRVPIEYESEIEFHINHTGMIVVSSFRQSDGSTPKVRPMGNATTPDPDDTELRR